jgi:hypothetical protein
MSLAGNTVMVMRGGVNPPVSIPFHSKNFGQIFNDDVTVYSPATAVFFKHTRYIISSWPVRKTLLYRGSESAI